MDNIFTFLRSPFKYLVLSNTFLFLAIYFLLSGGEKSTYELLFLIALVQLALFGISFYKKHRGSDHKLKS
jgi:predicted membrane metal-binding protein